jgi:hypothetical protein
MALKNLNYNYQKKPVHLRIFLIVKTKNKKQKTKNKKQKTKNKK